MPTLEVARPGTLEVIAYLENGYLYDLSLRMNHKEEQLRLSVSEINQYRIKEMLLR